MLCHVLDVRETVVREFAAALARRVVTVPWLASVRSAGRLELWEDDDTLEDPPLDVVRFPLQRGFHFGPMAAIAREHLRIGARLLRRSKAPDRSVLVCAMPHYAPVAEAWPGPVVYYATDLFARYDGWDAERITELEQRLTAAATLVCPNSARIAAHLESAAGCRRSKIVVLPNATRAANVTEARAPAHPPEGAAGLRSPIAGVIGNLGDNTDWVLLGEVIARTPWLSWLFVGPCSAMRNAAQREARAQLLSLGNDRVRFVGARPYGSLQSYARALDVAVLPYRMQEPTFSGSATRFYEHLAAGCPMLATPAVDELLSKEPLLQLASTPERMVGLLEHLRSRGFEDGQEQARRSAAAEATWDHRAASLLAALASSTGTTS